MIEESEFLGRFEGVQASGGGWVAKCPAHGDDNPSLSISRGSDGRWLIHCHAGCSAEAVVEAVGLKMRDLMPDNGGKSPRPVKKTKWGKWVCDYNYTDPAGVILYKSSRYVKDDGKKTFIIKVPDETAPFGWSFGLSRSGIKRVPFRLPRVIAAAKSGKTVVVVEGEKDVLTVEETTGCAATCNVAGAMKWGYQFPENWIEWFKGAKGIIVIADNDPEYKTVKTKRGGVEIEEKKAHWKGQRHAWDVRRRFLEAGFEGKIKLMTMPPVPAVVRAEGAACGVAGGAVAGSLKDGTLAGAGHEETKAANRGAGSGDACDGENPSLAAERSKILGNATPQTDRAGKTSTSGDGGERPALVYPKDFTDWVQARRAAGLAADREAFLEAVRDAAPWPKEWNFEEPQTLAGGAIPGEQETRQGDAVKTNRERGAAPHGGSCWPGPSRVTDGDHKTATSGDGGESPANISTAGGIAGGTTDGRAAAEESGAPAIIPESTVAARGSAWRWGRPVPRAPGEERRKWRVDFDVGGGIVAGAELEYGEGVLECFGRLYAASVAECPDGVLPKGLLPKIKAWSVALWLLMRGKFFWHADYKDFSTAMFLDCDRGSCTLMRIMSDEFFAFVGRHARLEDVDPKKGDMAKIMGLVKQISVSPEYSEGVRPGNSWERKGDAVYISNGDTKMCRIKGGDCEMVQNGTDGVVFLRGKTLAPWTLLEGGGSDPFESAKIFTGASFADKTGAMNVRLWTLNLFAGHATKPPLLITGGAGSGKTRMAKGIKEILGVRQDGQLDMSVQQIEDGDKGLDAFWATVNDGKLEVFDNFDTKVKWASDTLQTAATDGQTKRRTLYTTFGVSILRANAHIILTSNNPVFSTEGNGGLADRLITIPLTLNRSASQDAELSAEIAANRDAYLTWIARTLARALIDKKAVDKSINRRHPDYGEFSVKIGRAIGREEEAIKALGSAEADKAILPLMNDAVAKEIVAVLSGCEFEWTGTAGEMSEKIISRQGDDEDEKTKTIFSSRRVGKAFNKYMRQFSLIFRMEEPRTSQGRSVYAFHGVTELGRMSVGLVDLEPTFPTPYARAQENKVFADTREKPTKPTMRAIADTVGAGAQTRLDAPDGGMLSRARFPAPLSGVEEGKINIGSEADNMDGGGDGDFDWDI